ncbi:MAG: hypothetical protein AAF733_00045 [Verrucomicrobiota bacterium]
MGIADPNADGVPQNKEEGVVLNSQPENADLPGSGSSASARSRVISFDVKTKASLKPEESIDPEPVTKSSEMGPLPVEDPRMESEAGPPADLEPEDKEEESNMSEAMEMEGENQPLDKPASEEEPLPLHCPKCNGELVLMPQHIGVEGSCVWCDTKIVAARSGKDRQVRVFALFQPADEKPAESTKEEPAPKEFAPVPEAASDPVMEEVPEVDGMVSRAKMEPAPMGPETAGFASEEESKTPAEEAPANDWSGGFDRTPEESAPAEETEKEDAVAAGDFPAGFEASADSAPVDSFAGDSGFPEGFGSSPAVEESETSTDLPESKTEEVPDGFGAPGGFASEAAASMDAALNAEASVEPEMSAGFADGFSAGTYSGDESEEVAEERDEKPAAPAEISESWGAMEPSDEAPAGFSASPFVDATSPTEDLSPLPTAAPEQDSPEGATSGFSEPTPWGPPTAVEPKDASTEKAPVPELQGEKSDFGAGFGAAPPESGPAEEEASSLWGDSDSSHEQAAWGAASEEKPAEPETSPERSSDAAPAALEEAATGFGSGFEIPASDSASFSADMGTTSVESLSEDDAIFSDGEASSPENETESWGSETTPQPEGTPETLGPKEEDSEPIFESTPDPEPAESPEEKPQLFGGKSNDDSGSSLFGSPSSSEKASGPPPLQNGEEASEDTPAKSGNGLFSNNAPQVTSQPLGSKPARKKGKGLIVLLVIILGLVCGAALASFVLPVDEYVAKAQSFMKEKLNMEPDVDPAAFLSEMIVPGASEPAAPGLQPAPAAMQPAPQATPPASPVPATPQVTTTPAAPATAPQPSSAPLSEASAPAPAVQTVAPSVESAPQAPAVTPSAAPGFPVTP